MKKSIFEDRDEFINKVALECIAEMKDEEVAYFKGNPDPIRLHFSYGMYIRNRYIHGKNLKFFYIDADGLSRKIIERIIELINDGEDGHMAAEENL